MFFRLLFFMGEFVFVNFGDEKKFIERAIELGHKELNLVYNISESSKLNSEFIKSLKDSSVLSLNFILDSKEQKNTKKPFFDGFLQLGTSSERLFSGVNFVYNNETEAQKDFIHQRRSGLNHVLLKEMAEKNIGVIFSYSELQNSNSRGKALILGRIKQNIKLCRKYGVNCEFACLSGNVSSMRNILDVAALSRLLQ